LFKDYIDYAKQIEDRYLRKHGEVLTFGSGDCGQLGHGVDRDEDLMVKYPRIVLALRDKKVCGIACGGLHNAVYTDSGQVYTWGCADDGSLGRIGISICFLLLLIYFHYKMNYGFNENR
jgi:alpha-tubulin suppressor-like RCC1 family protein